MLRQMVTAVSVSPLIALAGMSSPAALPLLSVAIAFLISVLDGLSQLMGSHVSAGGMPFGVSGAAGAGQQLPEVSCPSFQLFLS